MLNIRKHLSLAFHDLPRVFKADSGAIQQSVSFIECVDDFFLEIVSFEGHDVDAARSSRIAVGQHVGCDILQDPAGSTDEGVASNGSVMSHCNRTRKRRMIVNMNVTAKQCAVANDDVVTHNTVVGDMYAAHQVTIASQPRESVFLERCAIDGDAFANDVAVADYNFRVVASVACVLGCSTDHGVGRNDCLLYTSDAADE